jgi:hypothetical protein
VEKWNSHDVPIPPIVLPAEIITLPGQIVIDSISVADSSGKLKQPQLMATGDTTATTDERDSLKIKAKYYFPPLNKFAFNFTLRKNEKTTIIEESTTVQNPISRPFYKNIKLGLGYGGVYSPKDNRMYHGVSGGLYYIFDLF